MLVYKYRGGNMDVFERDLNSLEKNYYWSSNFENLNDPQENIINTEKYINQSNWLGKIFGKKSKDGLLGVNQALDNLLSHNEKIGIYSLSNTYNDKLLWAHYANSHKGFCIEYELNFLLNNYVYESKYSFPVVYSKNPPQIDLNDIANTSKNNILIQKAFGYKPKEWEYENEYRIVTDNFGIHSYDYKAVKSIYFGLKMLESQKTEIVSRLKGRNIKYYQIIQQENNYNFEAVHLKDFDDSELTYLKQVPKEITKNCCISYVILEKFYIKISKKAEIKIELESKINKYEMKWLSNYLYEHLFQNADRVYIYFYIKSQDKEGIAWATSHIINKEISVSINEYSL